MDYTPSPVKRYGGSPLKESTGSRMFKIGEVPASENAVLSSGMIDKLIKENKELKEQLAKERDRNDKLVEFASKLKEKLIKYRKGGGGAGSGAGVGEDEVKEKLLQISSELSDIKELCRLPLPQTTTSTTGTGANSNHAAPDDANSNHAAPGEVTEDDILVQESKEVRLLKQQVAELNRRIEIKRANELEKEQLEREIEKLNRNLGVKHEQGGPQEPQEPHATPQREKCDTCESCEEFKPFKVGDTVWYGK